VIQRWDDDERRAGRDRRQRGLQHEAVRVVEARRFDVVSLGQGLAGIQVRDLAELLLDVFPDPLLVLCLQRLAG
jgi:hypothetical protein